jgi:hypothetical protein
VQKLIPNVKFVYIYKVIVQEINTKPKNTIGGHIFKQILEDKNAISMHLKNGGKLSDLKDKYKFAKPISIKRKG